MKFFLTALTKRFSFRSETDATSAPENRFTFINRLGLYKHAENPGYYCGCCKSPVAVAKNGWRCQNCGKFFADMMAPIPRG